MFLIKQINDLEKANFKLFFTKLIGVPIAARLRRDFSRKFAQKSKHRWPAGSNVGFAGDDNTEKSCQANETLSSQRTTHAAPLKLQLNSNLFSIYENFLLCLTPYNYQSNQPRWHKKQRSRECLIIYSMYIFLSIVQRLDCNEAAAQRMVAIKRFYSLHFGRTLIERTLEFDFIETWLTWKTNFHFFNSFRLTLHMMVQFAFGTQMSTRLHRIWAANLHHKKTEGDKKFRFKKIPIWSSLKKVCNFLKNTLAEI